MRRRVGYREPALLFMFTYFPPVAGVASISGWNVMWVFVGGFLIMMCATILAARILTSRRPGSYVAELVRETAQFYLFIPYLGVLLGLALWFEYLGLDLRVAIVISVIIGGGGFAGYHRWLQPALRKRHVTWLAFLDGDDSTPRG